MPDFLRREIGPFPVAIWLVIIVVGAGAGIALNRRIGAVDEAPVVLDPDTGRDPFSAGVGAPAPYYTGATLLNPAPASDPVAPLLPPATNDEWLIRAVKSVTAGDGSPLPLAALDALQLFLDGQPRTPAQDAIVNRALGALGPPPYGAMPSTSPTAPSAPLVKPTVPTAPAPKTYADNAERAVAEAYKDLLGRSPDASGLAYWSGLIRTGKVTVTQMRAHMANTPEALKVGQ